MNRTIGDSRQWHIDNGDYIHRLNYNLNNNSIVFDLGGYEGWFTEQINNKCGSKIYCFEPIVEYYNNIKNKFINLNNIIIFPYAISNENKKSIIYFNDNSSSMYIKTNKEIKIECVTLNKILSEHNIKHIDLIKINIEGEEYSLLEYMINEKIIQMCSNIQVQFHIIVDNYIKRYNKIRQELEKTHHLTYNYPFVWENWKKN